MDYALGRGIVQTITYYDVMDYPMTVFELWRHLIVKDANMAWSLQDVRSCLQSCEMREFVGQKNGFYFLMGREYLVLERRKRQRISLLKIQRLKRAVCFLRAVPFVRGVGITGRLAFCNAQESSDLDVLVILGAKHIWIGRILVTMYIQMIGMRRYGDKSTNRICLNYYVSDDSLTVPTQDLYGAHEYSFIVPLIGAEVMKDFTKANTWIRQYKPHYMSEISASTWTYVDHSFLGYVQKIGECVFGFSFLERHARKFQYAKIMNNPLTKNPGAMIIANDKHLVFLPKPHGPHVFEEYQRRLMALELSWPRS